MPSLTFTDTELDDLASRLASRLLAAMQSADGETQLNPSAAAAAGKLLWRESEAGKLLGVSGLTLKKWRSRGYIKATTEGRPILYAMEELEKVKEFIVRGGRRHGK